MTIPQGLHSQFVITLIAAMTPLIVARLPGPRVPEVVLLIVLGIVVGPGVLGLAQNSPAIDLIANVGIGMLFFLGGFELDRVVMMGQNGRAAAAAWLVSMALALGVVGMLAASGFVRAVLPVAIALTTTALGTLLPILRDAGENRGAFGRAMIANGAIGERLPVLLILRRWFPNAEALRMALYSATGLPLIVAISEIGLQTGVMRPENAAALVGAGLLSVIFLPMLARMLPQPALVPSADNAQAVPVVE